MATQAENLVTIRDQIDARIIELTASINPDQSNQGRSVQLAGLLNTLLSQREAVNKLIAQADGPGMVRSYGVS